MEIKIEPGCISCGLCVSTCPTVFKMGETETAVVANQPDAASEMDAQSAAEQCPVGVIKVEE